MGGGLRQRGFAPKSDKWDNDLGSSVSVVKDRNKWKVWNVSIEVSQYSTLLEAESKEENFLSQKLYIYG